MSNYTPVLHRPDYEQDLYRFANGYGASVITSWMAYGGRELAVIAFDSEEIDHFELVYDTPITSDVIGSIDDEQLESLLERIEELPRRGPVLDARGPAT